MNESKTASDCGLAEAIGKIMIFAGGALLGFSATVFYIGHTYPICREIWK